MISIIIPAYNEENKIGELIAYLRSHSHASEAEIIVVDGGSSDQTVKEANNAGAMVVTSPKKGRAKQMNFGASKASGELLYFLHADTRPSKTFIKDIQAEVNAGYEAGCFRLKFDNPHKALTFYSWFTQFDLDVLRFGDQSLFVTKTLFNKIGGFDEDLLVMEDQVIVTELKECAQFSIIQKPVITSARKYEFIGFLKLQVIFFCILAMYYAGLSQEALAHFYQTNLRTEFSDK
jgi:rSAM/selenodomain-associated transferase 2